MSHRNGHSAISMSITACQRSSRHVCDVNVAKAPRFEGANINKCRPIDGDVSRFIGGFFVKMAGKTILPFPAFSSDSNSSWSTLLKTTYISMWANFRNTVSRIHTVGRFYGFSPKWRIKLLFFAVVTLHSNSASSTLLETLAYTHGYMCGRSAQRTFISVDTVRRLIFSISPPCPFTGLLRFLS